jgi:hypothetical protein
VPPRGGCLESVLLDPLRLFLGDSPEQRRRVFRLAGLQEFDGARESLIARLRAFLPGCDRCCDLLLLPGKLVRSTGNELRGQLVDLAFKLLVALLFARVLDEAAVAPIEDTDHTADCRDRAKSSP